jgi:hypothetical protein
LFIETSKDRANFSTVKISRNRKKIKEYTMSTIIDLMDPTRTKEEEAFSQLFLRSQFSAARNNTTDKRREPTKEGKH